MSAGRPTSIAGSRSTIQAAGAKDNARAGLGPAAHREFHTRRQAMSREWHLKRDRKFRKVLAQGVCYLALALQCFQRALQHRSTRSAWAASTIRGSR